MIRHSNLEKSSERGSSLVDTCILMSFCFLIVVSAVQTVSWKVSYTMLSLDLAFENGGGTDEAKPGVPPPPSSGTDSTQNTKAN